jgi:hypothetical protein
MNICIPSESKSSFLMGAFRALLHNEKFTASEAKWVIDLLRERPELLEAEIISERRTFFRKLMRQNSFSVSETRQLKEVMGHALGIELESLPGGEQNI